MYIICQAQFITFKTSTTVLHADNFVATPSPLHNGVNTISEVSKKETVKNLKPLLIDTNIPKDHRIMDFSEFLRLEMDFMSKLSVKVSEIGPKKA